MRPEPSRHFGNARDAVYRRSEKGAALCAHRPLEFSSAVGTGPGKVIKMIKVITHGASASLDHLELLGRRQTAAAAAPPAITPGTRLSYGSLLGGEPRSVERLRPEEANDGIVSQYARG